MENSEKSLIQARTAWKIGRLGNGQILEWKPFLVGFRLEFDGVADEVIARRVKKHLLHKMYSRCLWIAFRSIFDVLKSISISRVHPFRQMLY